MHYETHIFDCDGVLLQTNANKSQAFYHAALPYGERAARLMVEYHQRAGSITREERWHHFFREIIGLADCDYSQQLEQAVNECSQYVQIGAQAAELVPGVEAYLESLAGSGHDLHVVSGVATYELRNILAEHRLDQYFSSIEGGPPHKKEILLRDAERYRLPAVYYGDTFDDFECAKAAGLDFVFVSHCTEMVNWQEYFQSTGARTLTDFVGMSGVRRSVKARVNGAGWADVEGEMIEMGPRLAGAEVTFER